VRPAGRPAAVVTPAYQRPSDVAMVPGRVGDSADPESDTLYLSHLPTGSLVVLQGTSALIYAEALDGGRDATDDDVTTRLADKIGMTAEDIRGDVETFLVELTSRGLLEAT
jgi:hypothetical protein